MVPPPLKKSTSLAASRDPSPRSPASPADRARRSRPRSTGTTPLDPAPPVDPRIALLKTQLAGRHVLIASNRSAPEIEALLAEHLGIRAEIVATASNPRRRQALHARIVRGSYDIVLVAHGFTGHVDTEQLGAACRQAGVPFHLVDKGRFARIVDVLWTHHRPGPAAAARIAPPAA